LPETAIEKVPEFAVEVVVVELEVVVGGSSADVPTLGGEAVLDVPVVVAAVVEVDGVFPGVVAEVATDVVVGGVEVVAVVVPELLAVVVAVLVAAVLAPVAELVFAVEEAPQALSAVITAQQESRRTV